MFVLMNMRLKGGIMLIIDNLVGLYSMKTVRRVVLHGSLFVFGLVDLRTMQDFVFFMATIRYVEEIRFNNIFYKCKRIDLSYIAIILALCFLL